MAQVTMHFTSRTGKANSFIHPTNKCLTTMGLGFWFMPRSLAGRCVLHLAQQALRDQWYLHKGVAKFFSRHKSPPVIACLKSRILICWNIWRSVPKAAFWMLYFNTSEYYTSMLRCLRYMVVQLVDALHYEPEGCRFDSQWSHCDFSPT
jgi:hypothetical protein